MSQLKVNSIIPVAGVPTGGGGGIIQIKQTVQTDTASSSADSFTNIGPTVSITPTSSTSKILVRFSLVGFGSAANYSYFFRLARGGSAIGVGDASGSRTQASTTIDTYGDGGLSAIQTSFEFLDSPATTSATTYSIQFRRGTSSAGTFYIGRNDYDADEVGIGRYPTIITAMEVSA
jgi:hypothetical protein|tara:strand:- start:260 stop:787 length:528 start_codon:yes stop_codon:yes gene_type:complete